MKDSRQHTVPCGMETKGLDANSLLQQGQALMDSSALTGLPECPLGEGGSPGQAGNRSLASSLPSSTSSSQAQWSRCTSPQLLTLSTLGAVSTPKGVHQHRWEWGTPVVGVRKMAKATVWPKPEEEEEGTSRRAGTHTSMHTAVAVQRCHAASHGISSFPPSR